MRHKAAIVLTIACVFLAGAVAFAVTRSDTKSCNPGHVAQATATTKKGNLTVINPPPGSVASGGGQRIEVNGHSATLKGPGQLEVRCRD